MCNREAASVEAAAQKWAGAAVFVGVAWTGSDDAFQGFIDKHGMTFPQISDNSGTVFQRFGVPSQPAFVVVAPDGTATSQLGAVDEATLDELISSATAG